MEAVVQNAIQNPQAQSMYQTHPMTVGTGRHSGPITLHKTTLSQ